MEDRDLIVVAPENPPPLAPSLRRQPVLDRLAWLFVLGLIALIAVRYLAYQWDFHMFYGSAKRFSQGGDPYQRVGLSFYHPPLTLYVYRLFTFLPLPAAYELWYGLKLLALVGLFTIWNRRFLRLTGDWLTVCYFLFAFNAAIYSDLVTGNVSIFEQLGLWLGFAFLLRGRVWLFCLCVILAAQVKLTPTFFAVLLLVTDRRPRWLPFLASLAGFAAVFSLNGLLHPNLLRRFLTDAGTLDERGTNSASTLALIRDCLDRLPVHLPGADKLLFLAAVCVVLVLSARAVVSYKKQAGAPDPRLMIYLACLVFALISPRLKVYTYIVALIPALYLLRAEARQWLVPLVAIFVLFPHSVSLLPIRDVFGLFYAYLPLLGVYLVWYGYLRLLQTRTPDAATEPSHANGKEDPNHSSSSYSVPPRWSFRAIWAVWSWARSVGEWAAR